MNNVKDRGGPTGQLVVNRLTKSFGSRRLWSDVTFGLSSGEIMALRGDSGSGKSTLLNTIGLLSPVDSGTITYAGCEMRATGWRSRRIRVATVSFLFQDYALVEDATIKENLDIAGRPKVFSRPRKYGEVLERFGLAGREESPVYLLSGGEQQRLALARLLVRPTPIILADEPTAALDDKNAEVVLGALRELADDGRIIIIATHSDEVAAISTRTLALTADGYSLT